MKLPGSPRLSAPVVLLVLVALLRPVPLVAQEDGQGGHRKWVYALIGGLAAGVPAAFSSAHFDLGGGGCAKPECFAPIAAAVGATVGLLIGIERDEAAARAHVEGPRMELQARSVELPIRPVTVIPFRRGALVVGSEGIASVDESMTVAPTRGVRGLNDAAILADHDLIVGASSSALFGFDSNSRASRARRLYEEGAPALASDGAGRLLFGGVGSLRVLRAEGTGAEASLTEEARASLAEVPSRLVWPAGGDVVWMLGRQALVARRAGTLEELGRLVLPTVPVSIRVDGGLAVAAAGDAGVYILDVSRPESPRLVGRYAGVAYAQDAAVLGTRAWVAAGTQGLVSLDLSTPSDPVVTGVSRNMGHPSTVVVSEDGLFVLDRQSGELKRVPLSPEPPESGS